MPLRRRALLGSSPSRDDEAEKLFSGKIFVLATSIACVWQASEKNK